MLVRLFWLSIPMCLEVGHRDCRFYPTRMYINLMFFDGKEVFWRLNINDYEPNIERSQYKLHGYKSIFSQVYSQSVI